MLQSPNIRKQHPAASGLAALTALGVAHALWALFQWTQLVAARTGGRPFCGFGDTGGQACTAVWDSEFASAVQTYTALPVAGWGLVWSLVAFALPLSTLAVRAAGAGGDEARDAESREARLALWPATRLTGLAGLAVVGVLLAASALQGRLCGSCAVTYAIVIGYAIVCLRLTPLRGAGILRGTYLSAGAVALAFVLLYVPGLRTPQGQAREGRRVLEQLAAQTGGSTGPEAPIAAARERERRKEDGTEREARGSDPMPVSDAQIRSGIRDLLGQFDAELVQTFSDALEAYARAPVRPPREPRFLIGSSRAPVRITEFTDALCGHCADLHETLAQLRAGLPSNSFSVEPRHFPLDASCNSEMTQESTSPVRCIAARAQICLEGQADFLDFSGSLFLNQQRLDEEKVYELAAPSMPRDELSACMSAATTESKLQSDIAWAIEHEIQGTPLVLVNGREAPAFAPLLYALILTRGDARHSAFEILPAPQATSP